MERIEAQQFLHKKTKKAIAAIRESTASPNRQVRPDPALDAPSNTGDATVTPASHWLSSAMAIWLQDDQDRDANQARGMR